MHLSPAEVRDLLGSGAASSQRPQGQQAVQHAVTQQLAQLRTCLAHGDGGDATSALRSMEATLDGCAARAEGALERCAVQRARLQRRRHEPQRVEPGLSVATRAAEDPLHVLLASPHSRHHQTAGISSRLEAQLSTVMFDLS